MIGDSDDREVPRLPDFVIIGAPKCGTTTLADWLRQRSDVHVPEKKEAEYFNLHHGQGLDWYARRLGRPSAGQLVGEATPAYLFDDTALARMAHTLPDARFVAVLREPVARSWSHYWFFRAMGVEGRSLQRALAAEDAAGNDGPVVPERHYLEHSRYARHLATAASLLGRDRLLVLFLEEIHRDQDGTWRQVCDHLGLDPTVTVDMARTRNPAHVPRSYQLQRALFVARVAQWAPQGFRRVSRWNLVGRKRREELTDEWRSRLAARFVESNAALADWLGRDLPDEWGQ